MTSGNFLLDENITFNNYKMFVEPFFTNSGLILSDIISIPKTYVQGTKSGLLLAISHDDDVSIELNNALLMAAEPLKKREEEHYLNTGIISTYLRNEHHYETKDGEIVPRFGIDGDNRERIPIYVGNFETFGVYKDALTASNLFPLIAQGLYFGYVDSRANDVVKNVSQLLDKKLRTI